MNMAEDPPMVRARYTSDHLVRRCGRGASHDPRWPRWRGTVLALRRATSPEPAPAPGELAARMVGIGMSFAAKPEPNAEIESTLVYASVLGMEEGDLRVLAVLTTWLGVHHTHVDADRLVRRMRSHPSDRTRAYWAAVAMWLQEDRRLARIAQAYQGPRIDVLPTGSDFQIGRRGEDERFIGSKLRVPSGTLRDRPEDVVSPQALARQHPGYRNRVLIGPSFHADVWTAIARVRCSRMR